MIPTSKNTTRYNEGIIQLIIIVILFIVILSLLGVSLRALLTDQTLAANFIFVWDTLSHVWETYGAPYTSMLFEKIKNIR
jgi:hypothetical protein